MSCFQLVSTILVAYSLYYLPGLFVFAVMLRKRRSFVGKRSKSAPVTLYRASPKRPKTRKGWPEESMTAALKAVEEGQSISQVARDHGIPKWTSPAETIASPGVSLTQHFSEVTPLTGIPIDMSTPGTRASVHNNTQISNFEPSSSCHSFCKKGRTSTSSFTDECHGFGDAE